MPPLRQAYTLLRKWSGSLLHTQPVASCDVDADGADHCVRPPLSLSRPNCMMPPHPELVHGR
jgi:hypothetical protein